MSNNSNDPNWLYLLLTLAAIGMGLIRSVQKKFKNLEQPEPLPRGEEPVLPEVRREPEPPFWYEKPTKPDRVPLLETRPVYVQAAEPKPEEKPAAPGTIFSESPEKEDRGSVEFDLKKAIIYSEILRRKYD